MILNRNNISSIILAGLSFILLIGAALSEFYQAPILSSKELSKLQYLFTQSEIENVKKIDLKTGLGEYKLNKRAQGQWTLSSPREIDANSELIDKVLDGLKTIKIKKIYPKDPINMANFSLDNPISKIKLTNDKGSHKSISFGLINPIDNSTYVALDNEKAIYHVNIVDMSFEKIDLTALIDSRIFNMKWDEIKSIKIIGQNKKTRLSFNRDKTRWVSKSLELNEERVRTYLDELTNMKSTIILDRKTEDMEKRLNQYLSRPYFSMEIVNANDELIKYEVSYIINSLPDIKMEKKQNFIIRATNRQHPFLVSKDYMKFFFKKNSSFKPIPIKKLIY